MSTTTVRVARLLTLRPILVGLAVSLLGATLAFNASPPWASAQTSRPVSDVGPDSRLSSSLQNLPVDSSAYRRAYDSWRATLAGLAEAEQAVTDNRALIVDLDASRTQWHLELTERRATRRAFVYDLDALNAASEQLAVASYVRGGEVLEAVDFFDLDRAGDTLYRQELESAASIDHTRRRNALEFAINDIETDIDRLNEQITTSSKNSAAAAVRIEVESARANRLRSEIPGRVQALRDARLTAKVVGTDLPLVALDAYVRAEAKMSVEKPRCGLDWSMVAALARIESYHGTIYGASIGTTGRTTKLIIGIALDGTNNTARIPDTDNGVLDGDTELDRAVGPLQFIPSTWALFRRDANGDGNADPHNIYDAALATASYLCDNGRRMNTTSGMRSGYLAYNQSMAYVNTAIANVAEYQALGFG